MSVRDQAFATLVLPAPGVLSWSTFNRIVMEWGTTETTDAFALISWPTTTLPLYVRANGTRYKLSGTIVGEPMCWSVPYAGQVLYPNVTVFEMWSGIEAPGAETVADIELTISYRKQLTCCDSSSDEYQGTLYYQYCNYYPVCLPICT